MVDKLTVIVTGGAGYIAAPSVFYLTQAGYTVAVIDRKPFSAFPLPHLCDQGLVTYYQADCGDAEVINRICTDARMQARPVTACFHFAAEIEVSTSIADPGLYYQNNVATTITLLNALRAAQVNRFIFSSSCAVYGIPAIEAHTQDFALTEATPRNPISPYGRTKMMIEMVLEDYARAYEGFTFAIIRYFNAAGGIPELNLHERHIPETHLIPRALAAAQDGTPMTICGTDYPTPDGTCIRDYIHIADLASAHIKALAYLEREKRSLTCNVGTGNGTSVKQVLAAVEQVSGRQINKVFAERRAGDPARLVADARYAQEQLGWKPEHSSIQNIVATAIARR